MPFHTSVKIILKQLFEYEKITSFWVVPSGEVPNLVHIVDVVLQEKHRKGVVSQRSYV